MLLKEEITRLEVEAIEKYSNGKHSIDLKNSEDRSSQGNQEALESSGVASSKRSSKSIEAVESPRNQQLSRL